MFPCGVLKFEHVLIGIFGFNHESYQVAVGRTVPDCFICFCAKHALWHVSYVVSFITGLGVGAILNLSASNRRNTHDCFRAEATFGEVTGLIEQRQADCRLNGLASVSMSSTETFE